MTNTIERRIDALRRAKLARSSYSDFAANRRKEMVQLYSQGLQYKQIAGMLGVSNQTVSVNINRYMHELGLSTHAQLGVWAAKQGIV